jgi:Xaa-Pro aminopeptidase
MFDSLLQSFDELADPANGRPRLAALRSELRDRDLSGFIVPRSDEHQNEYVRPGSERLRWLTGFSGSAGMCVVLLNKAAIFVDGRYTVQVREQVDTKLFAPYDIFALPPLRWLETNLKTGMKLGYDPWLLTPASVERFERLAQACGASLVALESNPIDRVWADRPLPVPAAISLYPARFAGQAAQKKIRRAMASMGESDALLVSDPTGLAWLLNIRGSDVPHTPAPLAFAMLFKALRPRLYVEERQLSDSVRQALEKIVDLSTPGQLLTDIEELGERHSKVRFDPATAPAKLTHRLTASGGVAQLEPDPIALMKASKNAAELAGTRHAHQRDGAAVTQFLAWFDAEASTGKLTEIAAAEALESFRQATGKLKDLSFPTIAAAGPHAAMPHYRVNRQSNQRIGKGLFLIDSGAQYEDGTTDITRTIAVGNPDRLMRDRFTRVLKGHIAIARLIFPKGVSGAQIDAFARQALWEVGLDFDHGTGHGIGAYLSVHEGPQRIAKTGTVALQPGMIISNEPGYYRVGHWGIRTENLIVVTACSDTAFEREMLGFETISLAPIDLRLVEPKLLTDIEVDWLNAYHLRVRRTLSPLLDRATRLWLARATRPLAKHSGKRLRRST